MSIKDLETRRSALVKKNQELAAQKQFHMARNNKNIVDLMQEQIDKNNQVIASFDRLIENEFNFG